MQKPTFNLKVAFYKKSGLQFPANFGKVGLAAIRRLKRRLEKMIKEVIR
jgi:hypothetical protein